MTRIGIISFAHIHAYFYAECLNKLEDVEFAGIYDTNRKRGRDVSKKYKTKFYTSLDKLLENVDGVIITSENSLHKKYVSLVAPRKKHILCEKPIATSIRDAESMIKICKKNDVKLQIAYPCRFSPAVAVAKKTIEEGKIGKLLAIAATNRGKMPGLWFGNKKFSGGGAIMDHTVHVVDLIRWITAKEPKKVYAEGEKLIYNYKVEDCGLLTVDFDGDFFATIDTSWSRPRNSFPFWGDVTLKLVGENGTIELDLFNQKMEIYSEKLKKYEWVHWGDDLNLELIKSFVRCIKEGGPPPITGEDGLAGLKIITAAYSSIRKKTPIEI